MSDDIREHLEKEFEERRVGKDESINKVTIAVPNPEYEIAIQEGQTEVYDLPPKYIYTPNLRGTAVEAVLGCVLYSLDMLHESGAIFIEPERVEGVVAGLTMFLKAMQQELDARGHGQTLNRYVNNMEERWRKRDLMHMYALDDSISDEELEKKIEEIYHEELNKPLVHPITK